MHAKLGMFYNETLFILSINLHDGEQKVVLPRLERVKDAKLLPLSIELTVDISTVAGYK
jgi:hypothetical protein